MTVQAMADGSGNATNRLAQFNLIFVVFVILWGAWVRLSGSGAGCGEHWPLCNGQALPLDAGLKTMIELTHRLTSGIFGITIAAMAWIGFRKLALNANLKKWLIISGFLTLLEAFIGAVLVKQGLVDQNDSALRAWVIGLHLVNTFFLVASIVLAEYLSRFAQVKVIKLLKSEKFYFIILTCLFLLAGSTGAVTALGNTLFPESSLVEGMKKDFLSSSHFLIKLRIYHPMIAVSLVLLLINFALKNLEEVSLRKTAQQLLVAAIVALSFGVVNWLLMAPKWGAIVHLALANILWIIFVYLYAQKVFKNTETNQYAN